MTYEEALAKIDSYERFSRRPTLERIAALLERLGNPQDGLRFFHVAGTNGKGTTCTLLASVMTAAGYRTGLYLSPHVCDFRERMQVDGEPIPKEELAPAAERVFRAADELEGRGVRANEFEVITAAAMLWFSERKCDVVALETGLGGRYDATNVVRNPLVSVITSISLDHTQVLGDTVEQIAAEKSGIIKPGRPVVCGPGLPPGALEVVRRAAGACGSRFVEADAASLSAEKFSLAGTELIYRGEPLFLPLAGEHQLKNAATALAVLDILRGEGVRVPLPAVRAGFAATRLPARLELISADPPIVVDGAHNPEGIAALADALRRFLPGREIVAVMGMMADKYVPHAVRSLSGLFSRVVAVAPPSPRAMGARQLADLWRAAGTPVSAAADAKGALEEAFSALKPGGALVICGSFYLAGELRAPALKILKIRKK